MNRGMKGRTMGMSHKNSRGFTLIAALLLTILLSGVAVGLLYMHAIEMDSLDQLKRDLQKSGVNL